MTFEPGKTIPELILEEIGLEGLEGITISSLWLRISASLRLPLPLLDNFQAQVWNFIIEAHNHLEFYKLPEPREDLKIWDRFEITDPDYGIPVEPDECPYTVYKIVPITDGNILGSCETYNTRGSIPFDEIKDMSIKDVETKWGAKTFVIVGSQALRYNCLVPPNVSIPTEITVHQYCVLEFIGRSRRNGVTSAGKFSILQCAKDSAIAFYIIKRLMCFGLIIKQAYTERRSDRLVTSSLITLNRFQSHKKTALLAIIEKIFLAIKQSPVQKLTLASVKALFPPENLSTIKKIMLTQFYRMIFESCTARAGDLPDVKQTPKMNKDREVVCVRLKNPNLTRDELFSDYDESDEKQPNDFYDYKHAYVDMPLMEEIYRAVEKHGSAGCNRSQLCSIMSANHLNIRQALKKAISDKLITSYCKDVGRQRTHMLVAIGCSNSVKKVKEDNRYILKNLKCDDEPNIPQDNDPPLKDIPQITATVKLVTPLPVNENGRDETVKQIERKQKIVEVVNEYCIIQMSFLRQVILKFEQEAGYKDEICNRSLYRTVARLQKFNVVNLYEINLRFDENARIYRYVTHPKITVDHPVMQREITKLKNALFLYVEDKKFRTSATGQESVTKPPRTGLLPLGPHKVPKFLTARFLHEFMFYILHEMRPDQQPIELSLERVHEWLESDPTVDHNELHQNMPGERVNIYTEKLSWRTFINPLPAYENKPFGWISLPDVVDRLPFSILNKLIRIPPSVDPQAHEYLLHPVRQHYMIKQLPLELQGLINRKRLSYIIISIIRVLHRMGLIQLSEKGGREALQLWIYINRRARVTDTTTSDVGYYKISTDREYKSIKFFFETHTDVEEFWNCLHRICIHTKLGFIHKNLKRSSSRAVYNKRRKQLNFLALPVASFDDAPALDTGIPPGDGLGAGGIASILFSSVQRNWTWLVNNKHTAAAAAAHKIKKNAKFIRIKLSKIMSGTGSKKSSFVPPSMTAKKMNRFAVTSSGRVLKRKETATTSKTKTKFPIDSIDRDALAQMRSLRARWSDKEDMILKMTRASLLFFAVPVLHFNHRDVARISRDIIRVQCGICNKTAETCHRRIQFMVKTGRHLPELPTWLHLLQTSEHLNSLYDGEKFFSLLKEQYPRKSDLQDALYVHFLYIYNYLRAELNPAEASNDLNKASIFPATLTEFYTKFRECTPLNESKTLLYFNPTTKDEVQLSTINNVLHSSLCCVRDKTQYNLQIFEIFKTYSEDTLHIAFKKARQDGLVVARKKGQLKSYTTQLAGPSYILSNRYRLCLMSLRIPYIVFDMFHAFFDKTVQTIYGSYPTDVEIKSPHSAQLLFMSELLFSEDICVDIQPPSSMLTIDPTAQQSSTAESERILIHFHKALENAPATEYLKEFDALGALAPRVKFKAANVMYKLHYHPFDVISKLNNVQMHFFCFLSNLNNSVDISFLQFGEPSNLPVEDFCPFNECVMRGDDYLNVIQKIVMDHESVLEHIQEDNHMKPDGVENGQITLNVENLLTVFGKFDAFMRSKLVEREKRDIGSVLIKRAPLDLIGVCKEITTATDDMANKDEYEPTLNKEERIARAQDVFVVNLPKLRISVNSEKQVERLEYKGLLVPKHLVDASLQRDEVFDKVFQDTSWEYTNDSLDSLKGELDAENWSADEQKKIKELHDLIESNELGVPSTDILEHFPDIDFLHRAIKFLRENHLILRAGVSSFLYIHKTHVRQWLIHSRHIKRLVRESMGAHSLKRKSNLADEEQPPSKQVKLSQRGRRLIKAADRYDDQMEMDTTPFGSDTELLVLKPVPWIRVNGSLNRRVLDRWMASIVIESTLQCGCTVHDICLRFKQMHAVDVMFLLELLVDLKIVELRSFKRPKVGLFSQYQLVDTGVGDEFTDPRSTCVIASPDAMTRMNAFIGDKMYQTEFI